MSLRPQSWGPERARRRPHQRQARSLHEELLSDEVPDPEQLRRRGFVDPGSATPLLRSLALLGPSPKRSRDTLEALLDCADPDAALRWVDDFAHEHPELWVRGHPALRETRMRSLVRTIAFSRFLAERVSREPSLLDVFSRTPRDFEREHLLAQARRRLAEGADPAGRRRALRQWQARGQMAIAKFDLGDEVPLRDLFSFTSLLADTTLQASVEAVQQGLAERGHHSPPGAGFSVIALGKLGGEELNFSSDVDLMFVTRSGADTEAARSYHERLGRELARFVSERDVHGTMYRVDLRLRPEGSSGPLTRSLESSLRYYEQRGRPWERQMLLKARTVAGDLELGQQFLEQVRPFLIGRSLDTASIEQFKGLRARTEHRAVRESGDRLEIKNGAGGIRDIETVAQFLQLLHARQHRFVLHRNTLQALQRLVRVRALSPEDHAVLQNAYLFLRRVENRLQMVFDLPARHLPREERALSRLARSVGWEGKGDTQGSIAGFRAHLDQMRERTRAVYTALLGERFAPSTAAEAGIRDAVLRRVEGQQFPLEEMGSMGFADPAAAYRALQALAEGGSRFLPQRPETRALLADLTPRLLQRLQQSPDPDLALHHVLRVAARFHARHAFLRTLADQPAFLDVLVDLGSYSPALVDVLVRDPDALDSFVDSLLQEESGARLRRDRLDLVRLKQARHPVLLLSEYKSLELLRLGLRDIQGKAKLVTTLFDLAHLNVHVLRRLLELCADELGTSLEGFAVLAAGKLGGLEISYGADADVLFVVDGERWNPQRGSILAQNFLARASEHTQLGRLCKVDTRLRPEGSSGPLVNSLRSFESYYRSERAALFEFQALLKASALGGDRDLARQAISTLRKQATQRGRRPGLLDELRAMRGRLQSSADAGDLKRGHGGMLDVEFLVQSLQLRYGADDPRILQQNTLRALSHLGRSGVLAAAEVPPIREDYLFLRRIESRLQLLFGLGKSTLPSGEAELDALARRCGARAAEGSGPFLQRLRQTRDRLRARLEQELGPIPRD